MDINFSKYVYFSKFIDISYMTFWNFVLLVMFVVCIYSLWNVIYSDPGFILKETDYNARCEVYFYE
jgi:hypothetical protein